jgi:quinol-cytochrome oxidoreductase complex cytochrome b subunit
MERKGLFDRFLKWLDERLGIYGHVARPAPKYAYRLDYWLGGFVLASLIFEIITGAIIALYYSPSDPYKATIYLVTQVPFGALLFSLHTWGAYVMVGSMLVHMTRNFIVGAYRPPRELMWIVGTILAGLTLTEAYLGYSLPYNLISWVATTTGLNLFSYMPLNIGSLITIFTVVNPDQPGIMSGVDPLVHRFFIFHWIVGGLLLLVVSIHLYIFEIHGITPPLRQIKPGKPELIDYYTDKLERYPEWKIQPLLRSIGMVIMIFLATFATIFIIASIFPFDISIQNGKVVYTKPEFNPTEAANTPPLPDWYFLFVYFFYKAIDPANASLIFLGWVIVTILFPFIETYIFRHKGPHPALRPASISLGTGFIIAFIVNSVWAYITPGVEIGTIGLVVDAVIFLASFAILWPILRYKIQPKVLAKLEQEPLTDGGTGIVFNKPSIPSIFDNKLILIISNITILSLIVYSSYLLIPILTMNLVSQQFEMGKLIGLQFALFAILLYVNLVARVKR